MEEWKMERNQLNTLNAARLTMYMAENYTKLGYSDRLFAQHASQKLGFPVAVHHVNMRRKTLGIPANHQQVQGGTVVRVSTAEFEALKARVEALEQALVARHE